MQTLVRSLQRYLPLWLLVTYALAIVAPGPGLVIRDWGLPSSWPAIFRPSITQILVAVLLWIAALGTNWRQVATVLGRPHWLAAAMVLVWLVPGVVAIGALPLLGEFLPEDIAFGAQLGAVLVASVPVANSAAAWSQQAQANVAWALGMVVASIVVCPWVTPWLLLQVAQQAGGDAAYALTAIARDLGGAPFVFWVLVPTAAGLLLRHIAGAERCDAWKPRLVLVSAAALLAINYVNAAVALPPMLHDFEPRLLLASVSLATVLCTVGYGAAELVGLVMRMPRDITQAVGFGLGMKHTGLALVAATPVLADYPAMLLPIVTLTLVQHITASLVCGAASRKTSSDTSPTSPPT